jgi:hypothetical protein
MKVAWYAVAVSLAICVTDPKPAMATGPASEIQASAVLADIQLHGPEAVVASLRSDQPKWDDVMAKIAGGKNKWLRVAGALRPATDGGASETLDEAVFLALKPASAAVLKLLMEGRFSTDSVCSSNIARNYSEQQSRRLIRERISILTGLSATGIQAMRDDCVTKLAAALKDLRP